jgi:NADPH:quinone reductase
VALGALHVYGDDDAWAQLRTAGEAMLGAIAEGGLKPEVRVVHTFEDLAQRLDALRHRNFSGKLVIRLH